MPQIKSRRHSGQFWAMHQHTFITPFMPVFGLHTKGSFGSSLGCGTKMVPSLAFLTLCPRAALARGSRSSSVAVPALCND